MTIPQKILEPKFEPGYLGDSHHTLRTREVFKYFQPENLLTDTDSDVAGDCTQLPDPNKESIFREPGQLVSSHDPVLTCFANLMARMLDCQRAMITMVGAGVTYIVAESTRSLSIDHPHTYAPGEQLWVGGGAYLASVNSLCEHVVALVPDEEAVEGADTILLEIPDLSKDPKFGSAPYVYQWPYKKFYAGVPLRTRNGVSIGTCCVLDPDPRPDGMTDEEKLVLGRMGDIVMSYLETVQADRDTRRSKVMEMGLSKFIAEGYLPSDGMEMTERRDGRLWSEDILKQRRVKEMERKKRVEQKRSIIQEKKHMQMLRQRSLDEMSYQKSSKEHLQDEQEKQHINPQPDPIPEEPEPEPEPELAPWRSPPNIFQKEEPIETPENPQTPCSLKRTRSNDDEPAAEVKATVLNVPVSTKKSEAEDLGITLVETVISPPQMEQSKSSLGRSSPTSVHSDGFISSFVQTESLFTPRHEPRPIFDGDHDSPDIRLVEPDDRRRSNYECSSSFEPSFRAMFSRAAKLIQDSVDAEVVFIDGDLEGFFGNDECEKNCGLSHVSTDKKSELATRAGRPKSCRRRSGILGYATSVGSSGSQNSSSSSVSGSRRGSSAGIIESMGFDLGELSEVSLNKIVEENPQGRIIVNVDEYSGRPQDERPEENETEQVLSRFLPGCKSVIFVPMYDHNQELFAACFAWTFSSIRTFFGDVEGSFISAVTNSIMAESTRLSILNADKAKGEFISSISHELRSPLHGILASAAFLGESNLDPVQRSFNDTIISCGKTLLDTINHVLDFQKLNSLQDSQLVKCEVTQAVDSHSNGCGTATPKEVAKFVDTDLSTLIQEVTEGVCLGYEFNGFSIPPIGERNTVADRRPITIIIDIDKRVDGWVFLAHPAALKRIINNLAGNSMKYTAAGWIRIRLRADDLPPDEYGNPRANVKISIADSGQGISREFLKTKLFTPFSQENPLTAGSGLGMSIVRQIVGLMDGKIDVKSQVGRGTKVTVQMELVYKPVKPELPTVSKPLEERSDADIRMLVEGKKVALIGFDTATRPDLPASEVRALTLFRMSLERCAVEYFGMKIVKYNGPSKPDFIFANEIDNGDSHNHQDSFPLGYEEHGSPIIAICNRSLVNSPDGTDRCGRIVTHIRKPFGPNKLVRALVYCLKQMQSQLGSNLPNPLNEHSDNEGFLGTHTLDGEFMQNMTRSTTSISGVVTPLTPPFREMHDMFPATIFDKADEPKHSHEILHSATPPMESLSKLQSAPSMQQTPPSLNLVRPKKPTVLAVEDNGINLMLLTTFLRKHGYPFERATNGLEAVRKVESRPDGFDIILMDIMMPIMSGTESTREIRGLERKRMANGASNKRSFIIALTGLAALSDQKDAFDAGVDNFMVKPVNFNELEKTLQQEEEKLKAGKEVKITELIEEEKGGVTAAIAAEDQVQVIEGDNTREKIKMEWKEKDDLEKTKDLPRQINIEEDDKRETQVRVLEEKEKGTSQATKGLQKIKGKTKNTSREARAEEMKEGSHEVNERSRSTVKS